MACASGAWRDIDPNMQCLRRSGKLQDEVLWQPQIIWMTPITNGWREAVVFVLLIRCDQLHFAKALKWSLTKYIRLDEQAPIVHTAVNISSIRVPESRWKELESCFDLLGRWHEGSQAHLADALGGTIMRKTVKLKSQLGDTGGAPRRADMQSASRRSIGDLHEDEHPHCSAGPAPLLLHDYRAIRCIPQKHLRIPTG